MSPAVREAALRRPAEVNAPSRESFHSKFELGSRPAIILDVAGRWPAFHKWTPKYLSQTFGGAEVTVGRADRKRTATLKEYLNYAEATKDEYPDYLYDFNFRELNCGALLKDFSYPEMMENWWAKYPMFDANTLWLKLGPCGTRTLLHIDRHCSHSWCAVLKGRKRWVMFPPSSSSALFNTSGADWLRPDLDKFPQLANLTPAYYFEQGPGEIVFTPSGWYHQVDNIGDGINIAISGIYMNSSNFEAAVHSLKQVFCSEMGGQMAGLVQALAPAGDLNGVETFIRMLFAANPDMQTAMLQQAAAGQAVPKGTAMTGTRPEPCTARAPSGTPSPGARVLLIGLRQLELNGCQGEVLRWVHMTGRLEVRLDKDGSTKAIRLENVQVLEEPDVDSGMAAVCADPGLENANKEVKPFHYNIGSQACRPTKIQSARFCAATACLRWSWRARHRPDRMARSV